MLSLFIKLVNLIADEVDKEYYSPTSIKNQIMQLEQMLKDGKITLVEYESKEEELLDRLEKYMEE